MSIPMRWRRTPTPDPSVVAVTSAVHEGAELGQIRCLCIVTINPNLDVEFTHAGELDEIRKTLLIGGLTRLINKLST